MHNLSGGKCCVYELTYKLIELFIFYSIELVKLTLMYVTLCL